MHRRRAGVFLGGDEKTKGAKVAGLKDKSTKYEVHVHVQNTKVKK